MVSQALASWPLPVPPELEAEMAALDPSGPSADQMAECEAQSVSVQN